MKKKTYWNLAALLTGSILLTGCAKTPEQSIVREKGSQNMENYKEATEGAEETETPSESESVQETAASQNALAKRLQVPEIYEASATSEDGIFTLTCNATVEVPDVETVSVYQVGRRAFDQEWIDTVVSAFSGDAPIYDGTSYFQYTKEEALQKLNELKEYQAEGNLDPYGYIAAWDGTDIPEEEIYSLQDDIDSWEQIYANAPETREKVEVTPTLDEDGYAFYAAELEDGSIWSYKLKNTGSYPMEITFSSWNPEDGTSDISGNWVEPDYNSEEDTGTGGLPTKEEAQEMAGITAEEAVKIADSYMEKLGLTDFSAKHTGLAVKSKLIGMNVSYTDGGYLVAYTRDINGFPVTYEEDVGGGLESMESTLEPWSYERIECYVNQEGLQQASILNLYEVGEQQVQNVEMMSFPEIAEIFEKMITVKNTGTAYADSQKLEITRVTLGYTRIYDPGADNTTGILVPVWDFFGRSEEQYTYNGETGVSVIARDAFSRLTVNAVDGTVIDRGLGY
ncbi:MAG: DUF6034 family protein [Eubacteriales bacterium]|nr:DUF6034 family protein [Eubacteriales bacterium]